MTYAEERGLPAGFRPPANPSSNIKAVAWYGPAGEDLLQDDLTGHPEPHPSAQTGKLAVLFMNGTRYDYQGVPRETVAELLEADSIGKAFNANIKGNEAYHAAKVDPLTGEPLTQEAQP
jgi:hypothetical protein